MEEASELAQLDPGQRRPGGALCLLVCHKSAQEAVLEALRDFRVVQGPIEWLDGHGPGK